ncbi:hypothetical protein M407DRAFT_6969 [Tulasnella calospora MUT 4182]|uniref:Uncharacterized protein n=1 Tax=Tulasnella calospora MUT 4182 TaxID=1051891 RepID=A0A0C3QKV7_9AGAM|nr:hypothetical protein M407DRAFT_6969 [Tulasnella calospora MUT 4182]
MSFDSPESSITISPHVHSYPAKQYQGTDTEKRALVASMIFFPSVPASTIFLPRLLSMLQARLIVFISLGAAQVWAQGNGSSGGDTVTVGLLVKESIYESLRRFMANPWWTFLNDTSGDACHIARAIIMLCCGVLIDFGLAAGLAGFPAESPTAVPFHPENAELCLPVVYDIYGACLTCQESSPPPYHMMPRTTASIESHAPEWTNKVDFTNGVWDLDQAKAAAHWPNQSWRHPAETQASPNPISSSHKFSSRGPIVGGVVGGLVLTSIGAMMLFLRLRRKTNRQVIRHSQPTAHIRPRSKDMSTGLETGKSKGNRAIMGQVSVATGVPTSSVLPGS